MADALQSVYPLSLAIFWICACGVLVLRPRWALLCLLLAANADVIQPGFFSTESVGWQNAVETLVLPSVLLLRMTEFRIPKIRWGFSEKAWMVLILYAGVSILWSPFKLSGVKMVAYLAAWFMLYLVLQLSWRHKILDERVVIVALWGSLILACIQTYIFGNPEQAGSHQFTSFTAAGSFAAFLDSLLALLLFSKGRSLLRGVSCAACALGIIVAGDRTALIGAGFLLVTWFLYRGMTVGTKAGVRFLLAIRTLAVCVVIFMGFRISMAWAMPESRLNELLQLGSQQVPSIQDVGTAAFRLEMYGQTLSEISGRRVPALVTGSGTSSGAGLAFEWEENLPMGLDPNRTIHNEFLRVFYEWGMIGLALGLALIFRAVGGAWRSAVRERSVRAFAVVGMLPAMLLFLLDGNVLAGPASAMGMGFLLVLTYGFSECGTASPKSVCRTSTGPVAGTGA